MTKLSLYLLQHRHRHISRLPTDLHNRTYDPGRDQVRLEHRSIQVVSIQEINRIGVLQCQDGSVQRA